MLKRKEMQRLYIHLPLLTEYHLIEVGGQFFTDTLFAFADSSGSGVADVGNDIVAAPCQAKNEICLHGIRRSFISLSLSIYSLFEQEMCPPL